MKKSRLLLIGIALIAAAVATLPWKDLAKKRIDQMIAAQGIEHLQFSMGAMGLHNIVFNDITFGDPVALKLDSIALSYSPRALWEGRLHGLSAKELAVKAGDIKLQAQDASVQLAPESSSGNWKGDWGIPELTLENAPLAIPALAGTGHFSYSNNKLNLDGAFQSADSNYKAIFKLNYQSGDEQSMLTLTNVKMPWGGGVLETNNVRVPLVAEKEIHIPLNARHLSLDTLMQALTSGRASAVGSVSGMLPVAIGIDGAITIYQGRLISEGPGVLRLSPDVIQGDNPQLALVRDVLQDFHYSEFIITLDTNQEGKLGAALNIYGSNPSVYDGRSIKLNVNLTGDVLQVIQQSILLANPKQLLKQGQNALH